MARFYYDLHTHSCLSPCADNDNTPFNLIGMGVLAGLQIMALTDHNTCRNCPAFFAAAEQNGVIPVAGMELTTAEDIHVICLFETLEDAMRFDDEVAAQRIRFPNRPDIFGEQWVWGANDEPLEQEPDLLSNATMLSLEDAAALATRCGGICYPAHIDRQANGIVSVLGTVPPTPAFSCVEFHDGENEAEYRRQYPLEGKRAVISSDAHYLWGIRDAAPFVELDADPTDSAAVRHALLAYLGGAG